MEKLRIEHWPVDRLRVEGPELRRHAKGDVERMAKAIQEYGFRIPVLALAGGEMVDGRLRRAAALRLELAEVPVIVVDGLAEGQVRALRLFLHTSVGWATWDDEALAAEISALEAAGFDLELTGFDTRELDRLLAGSSASERDPDAAPEPRGPAVTRAGDLWELGRHRLLCGDATRPEDLELLLAGRLADMAFTDPPYNVDYQGKAGKIANDKMTPEQFADFLDRAFAVLAGGLRPGGAVYVAHSEAGGGLAFRQAFAGAGFTFAACLIWLKNQFVLGRGDYHWQHEPVLYGWKPGGPHRWYGDRRQSTRLDGAAGPQVQMAEGEIQVLGGDGVFVITGQDLQVEALPGSVLRVDKPARNPLHPTMKPVELVERLVRNSSPRAGVVLDPFGGSGTTLMACERLGRRARLLELDPVYADVIVRRWEDYSGLEARLAGNGPTFAQAAAGRA